MLESKNPRGFVTETFKTGITNPQGFFLFEQLLFNKVDFGASDFEAAVGLQVEAAGKMKVAVGVLDHRTIQNCFACKNFFELTTPSG